MQYWTVANPCTHCGATSNTSHSQMCANHGLYDDLGVPLTAFPKEG